MEHLYKEIDGVAMDSPLGPTLANDFLVATGKVGYKVVHSHIDRFTKELTL